MVKELDVVALLEDKPERGLRRGQVGTVVEALTSDVFEVEFSDDEGRTRAMLAVPGDQLLVAIRGRAKHVGRFEMVDKTFEQELIEQVRKLSAEQRRRVLEFVKALERPPGILGWLAIQYADEINFPPEDLAEIEKAIEEACEIIEDFPDIDPDDGNECRETE